MHMLKKLVKLIVLEVYVHGLIHNVMINLVIQHLFLHNLKLIVIHIFQLENVQQKMEVVVFKKVNVLMLKLNQLVLHNMMDKNVHGKIVHVNYIHVPI